MAPVMVATLFGLVAAVHAVRADQTGAPTPVPPQPPGVAATVDGALIHLDDVKERAYSERSRHAVRELIDNVLIDQAAKQAGIVVTDAEIEAEKEFIRKSIAPQTLEDGMKEHDLTPALFDDVRRHDLKLYKLATIGLKPGKMAHVRQIFVHFTPASGTLDPAPGKARTEAQAQAIVRRIQVELKAGRRFEALAEQYDDDPAAADKHGDSGVVYDGAATDPPMNTAALALKAKEDITPAPIRADSGYRLLQLISTSDAHDASEDPLYDAAVALWRRQQANVRAHSVLTDLRAKAHIVDWING